MDTKTAKKIQKAAKPYLDTNYSAVNVFILKDGSVDIEPVSGTWGAGVPASPDQYEWYEMDVSLGWLEDTDTIMERLQ
jgi:hypothetical protein